MDLRFRSSVAKVSGQNSAIGLNIVSCFIKKKTGGWREADGLKGLFVAFGSMAFLCTELFTDFLQRCLLFTLPPSSSHSSTGRPGGRKRKRK